MTKPKNSAEGTPIVAVVGLSGAGKSNFINIATRDEKDPLPVGHGLNPFTQTIRSVVAIHPDGREIVLVDTPGFDETKRADFDTLKMIAQWLSATYSQKSTKLAGIIYMHRITDNRVTMNPHLYVDMFSKLCGDHAIQNVILVTTMWSHVHNKPEARQREQELRDKWWKTMLNLGSSIECFNDTFESAWAAIDVAIRKAPPDASAVQEDLGVLKERLPKNKAGTDLYKNLQTLISSREETLRKLRVEAKKARDAQRVQELNVQCEMIQEDLRKATDQLHQLRIPLGQKFLAFIGLPRKRNEGEEGDFGDVP